MTFPERFSGLPEYAFPRLRSLLDAATALREAEMRELLARADAHLARYRLAVKSGRRPETAIQESAHGSQAAVPASPPAPATSEQETRR